MGANTQFLANLLSFLGEENFEEALTNFLKNYAGRLEFSEAGEEISLKTHDVYTKWSRMVEVWLEKYCKKQGMSNEEFRAECQKVMEKSPAAKDFMNAFLSAFEFDRFIDLAKEYLRTGLISVHTGLCICLEAILEEEEGVKVDDDDEASIANSIFQNIVEASDRGTKSSMAQAKKAQESKEALKSPSKKHQPKGKTKNKKLAASAKETAGDTITFAPKDMESIKEFADMMEMTPQEAIMRMLKQHLFDLRQMQAEFDKVMDFN